MLTCHPVLVYGLPRFGCVDLPVQSDVSDLVQLVTTVFAGQPELFNEFFYSESANAALLAACSRYIDTRTIFTWSCCEPLPVQVSQVLRAPRGCVHRPRV